jgi:hypothetical protein
VADGRSVFEDVIEKYCDGPDRKTQELLSSPN